MFSLITLNKFFKLPADSKVELLIEVISKKCKDYGLDSIIGPIEQMQSPVIFMSSFNIYV